jgi:hypothetical protein
MRETGIGTSLILIAIGAILAFGVNVNSTAIDVAAVGVILLVVGLIGLLVSFIFLNEVSWWGRSGGHTTHTDDTAFTPPHEHRRVQTRDIVYEDDEPATTRVERVRHVRR